MSEYIYDEDVRWKIAREIIEHEDNLINHRYTWLLTLQGFMFTGLVIGVGTLVNSEHKDHHYLIHALLIVLAFAGIIIPILMNSTLDAARRHNKAVSVWWDKVKDQELKDWVNLPIKQKFPPIKGGGKTELNYSDYGIEENELNIPFHLGNNLLPYFLTIIWIVIFISLVYSVGKHLSYFPPITNVINTQVNQTVNIFTVLSGLTIAFTAVAFMFQSRHHNLYEHEKSILNRKKEIEKELKELTVIKVLVGEESKIEELEKRVSNTSEELKVVQNRYDSALLAFSILMLQIPILIGFIIGYAWYLELIMWWQSLLLGFGVVAYFLHVYGDLWLARKHQKIIRRDY
jgi:hypothetical protein